MKRILIAGSRDFCDYCYLEECVDDFISRTFPDEKEIVVMSGTARGADRLGEIYSINRKYDLEKYPADWDRYGRSAGFRRNEQMVEIADAAIMFWDGISHGTKHAIDISMKKGIPCEVKLYNDRGK